MKLTLFAACLVAGIALSSCFVHSMPRHYAEKIEEIECPEEGDFWSPHPDCTKYYLCTNGRLFVLDCSGGLYWNQETKECAFPEEVPQCVGGTREPEGPTEVPTEQPTTEPPTEQPTTEPPTEQPTTEPPTAQPTTEPPTEQPTTEPPTQPPTTEPPTTQRPTEVTTDEPEVSTADPSNPCTDEGIYALPSAADCAEYTQCVNGIAIPSKCANGLLFDPLIGKCNKEELVQCFNPTTPSVTTTEEPVTTTSEAPVTEAPICEAEGVYNKPFPSNCSLFILCANGVPVIQECASGLSFDPEELICVREEDSSCVVETTTTAAPEVTTTEASQETTTFEPEVPTTVRPPVRCENDGVYNIPDPAGGDCSTYFLCINFVPYQQSCAAGTVFSPEAGQCVREENYECPSDSNPTTAAATTTEATTPEPTTPEATTTEATTTTEPTTPEPTTPAATTPVNEFPCPESTGLSYHPHPTSCRLFYSCRDSQFGAIFDCGVGLYFDSKTQACVFPESSDCPHKPKP